MTPSAVDAARGSGAEAGGTEQRPRVAFLACGALAPEMLDVVERQGWHGVEIHGVSALHHLDPPKIAEDVDRKLAVLTQRFDKVVVVYADCGTGGALDKVIAKYPAVRPAGVHCYQWFLQEDPQDIVDNRTGTYFLTDWLIKNWNVAVMKGLGLDRFPHLKDVYFGSLTDVLYLRQTEEPDPELEQRARDIAAYMGLPIEIKDTGVTPLEALLVPLVEGD